LLAALVLAGAVSAAAGGRYKGKTKQGRPVSFRVTKSSVIGFKLTGNAICISAHKSEMETYPLVVKKKGKLKAGGKFVISYIKHVHGTTNVKVSGRVSGNSASGRVILHYDKVWSAPQVEGAVCWVKTTWKAKRIG
jgi:hypothetical protein